MRGRVLRVEVIAQRHRFVEGVFASVPRQQTILTTLCSFTGSTCVPIDEKHAFQQKLDGKTTRIYCVNGVQYDNTDGTRRCSGYKKDRDHTRSKCGFRLCVCEANKNVHNTKKMVCSKTWCLLVFIIIALSCQVLVLKLQNLRVIKRPARMIRNLCRDRRVILVGNGKSILEQKNGSLIDSFDVVVRFNSFRLHPQYTGKKTSVHVQSEYSMLFHDFQSGAIPIVTPNQLRFKAGANHAQHAELVPFNHVNSLLRVLPNGKFPSTGLIFMQFLNHMKIAYHVTGFDGNLASSTFEEAHYYDTDSRTKMLHGKNHVNERRLFRQFAKKGWLRFL